MGWLDQEREELESEYWARYDYVREAFGDTGLDDYGYDWPDLEPGTEVLGYNLAQVGAHRLDSLRGVRAPVDDEIPF